MNKLLSPELLAMLNDLKELNKKRLQINKKVEEQLIPKAVKQLKAGDIETVQELISEMPECVTRMKIAGILSSHKRYPDAIHRLNDQLET